jgi:hypothetical protein
MSRRHAGAVARPLPRASRRFIFDSRAWTASNAAENVFFNSLEPIPETVRKVHQMYLRRRDVTRAIVCAKRYAVDLVGATTHQSNMQPFSLEYVSSLAYTI